MNNLGNIQAVLGLIFGIGGAGALTVIVQAYRRLKTGKISDDESIITRLYKEIDRQALRADTAEKEAAVDRASRIQSEEHVARLRYQVIALGHVPVEVTTTEAKP